jgi:hypothetical protein
MIEVRIVRETDCMYKYEITVSGDRREYGRFARPKKAYEAAMKYCIIHGLDVDELHIPKDLKRIWGF